MRRDQELLRVARVFGEGNPDIAENRRVLKLAAIPGIGPMTATALVAAIADGSDYLVVGRPITQAADPAAAAQAILDEIETAKS